MKNIDIIAHRVFYPRVSLVSRSRFNLISLLICGLVVLLSFTAVTARSDVRFDAAAKTTPAAGK